MFKFLYDAVAEFLDHHWHHRFQDAAHHRLNMAFFALEQLLLGAHSHWFIPSLPHRQSLGCCHLMGNWTGHRLDVVCYFFFLYFCDCLFDLSSCNSLVKGLQVVIDRFIDFSLELLFGDCLIGFGQVLWDGLLFELLLAFAYFDQEGGIGAF